MAILHWSNPYYNHLDKPTHTSSSPPPPAHPTRTQSDTPAFISPEQTQQPPQARRNTTTTMTPRRTTICSYSGMGRHDFEIDTSPPTDDEIIIATVRITNAFRQASICANSTLPDRPRRRNFLRRMSTRLSSSQDENKYTAMKMPRRDYKRYFARDREGRYVGTEQPEREWTVEELEEVFGKFQDKPLRSIPGAQEFGEGDGWAGRYKVERGGGDGGVPRLGNEDGWYGEQMVVGRDGRVQGLRRVMGGS